MSTQRTEPRLERTDSTLVVSGRLDASGVAALRVDGADCRGIETIDIGSVDGLDSTGVALVADLVARCAGAKGSRPVVIGRPPGLEELCRAYRISPEFTDFP